MAYKTGFCGAGLCEGKAPVSPSGKPMKVCVAYDICSCDCHSTITQMYELAGKPRPLRQNPNYEPARNVDLSWLYTLDAASIGGPNTPAPVERPSPVAPSLSESARTFVPNAAGGRARGQLEDEVRRVCNRYMAGEIEGLLTTKLIATEIDKDNPPSQGAIGAVLLRWGKIGFADVRLGPMRFAGYTIEGMKEGLEKLKAKAKRR